RLGGLVEVVDGRPLRFTSVISYEGSSVPPLEILMRSRMSDVLGAVEGGSGLILGSYREIPENSVSDAKDLLERMAPHGFGGIVLFGSRGEPLLGISPTDGKVGIVVLGGLNVNAALEQAGVGRGTQAMATLCDYPLLSSIEALERAYLPRKEESSLFLRYLSRTRQESDDGYWSVLRALKQMTF
ncbi:MAG TPA: NrpR regulatory domain-containing protein, partial [Syntrophorhabdaceae bacterium]|nr:NrpR regulatory domain-containing protein [Syntrophorhabdaceae bacterium]